MAPRETDGQALRRLRQTAGWSLPAFAAAVHYDKGYLSRVENDRQGLSTELAQVCDQLLNTSFELTNRAIAASLRAKRRTRRIEQLPAAPTSLIGRDDSLRLLDEIFGSYESAPGAVPVVCIEGLPGVGKTALALRYAHSIAGKFPGGSLFAALAGHQADSEPIKAEEILADFLRALGVRPERIPASLEDRARLFRSATAGRGMLIVLDDAAKTAQVKYLLPGSDDCAVLITSRSRLAGLTVAPAPATPMKLVALDVSSAADLLSSVIGGSRITAEPEATQQLAGLCANLPLALRIVAVRIASNPGRSIADIASDLRREDARLDALEIGELDEIVTMRGVFSWSYRALPDAAARMFRLTGLHTGMELEVGAAAALAAVTWSQARKTLSVLAAANLVDIVAKDRYRIHDLVRIYAGELARANLSDDAQAAIHRLVDWYRGSIDNAVRVLTPNRPHLELPEPASGVEPVRFESDQYLEAMEWCGRQLRFSVAIVRLAFEHRLFVQAWQIPVTWLDYLFIVRPWDEWIELHEIAVEAAKNIDDTLGYGWSLTNLAEAHRRRHEIDLAQQMFEDAKRIAQGRTGRGWVLAGLGFTAYDRGDYATSVTYLQQMSIVFNEINDNFGVAVAYANLCDALREMKELSEARRYGEFAYQKCLSLKDEHAQGDVLPRLARTALAQADYDAALKYCDEAIKVCRKSGDRWKQAESLEIRGIILLKCGDSEQAFTSFGIAFNILKWLDEGRANELRTRLDYLSY